MPRDGSGVYHTPAGTDGVPDTTIESSKYNINVHDVETDLNTPRPIVAGGTGATNADAALLALSGEKAKQVVTNFNTMVWAPGSFYAATTATNSPVTSHAFAGVAYFNDVDNFVVEARDITDAEHKTYYRIQSGGVWGSWTDPTTAADARFVNVAGDTMTGALTMTSTLTVVTPPVANTDASSKKYVDDSISGLSSSIVTSYVRYDAAQALTAPQKIQARQNVSAFGAVRYQMFTASGTYTPNASMVFCIIETVGGGGSGGGVSSGTTGFSHGAGGGGAGGYCRNYHTAAEIGASKTITIGAGGPPSAAGTNGNAGGQTQVVGLSAANGGSGGLLASNNQMGGGGPGGPQGAGHFATSGAPGIIGQWSQANNTTYGGGGGSTYFGGGGAGGANATGGNATGWGGGGGGASAQNAVVQRSGGAGYDGLVFITEFCMQ